MARGKQTILAIFTIVALLMGGLELGLASQQYAHAETGTSGDDDITTVAEMMLIRVSVEMTI